MPHHWSARVLYSARQSNVKEKRRASLYYIGDRQKKIYIFPSDVIGYTRLNCTEKKKTPLAYTSRDLYFWTFHYIFNVRKIFRPQRSRDIHPTKSSELARNTYHSSHRKCTRTNALRESKQKKKINKMIKKSSQTSVIRLYIYVRLVDTFSNHLKLFGKR